MSDDDNDRSGEPVPIPIGPGRPRTRARPEAPAGSTFEDVYARSYRRMTRLAHLMTGSNGVAEEVVQDAFVALYRRFASVDDPEAYLYRSVANGCRARYRRKQVGDRLIRLREVRGAVDPPDVDETWAMLRRLSARRRAAVTLRYYADLPVAEIAEILGCRPATVRSLLHRGLADLKELLVR